MTTAETFAWNLKQMLQEEEITVREFMNDGPIGKKIAREFITGKILPSKDAVKRIAQYYKVDADRLLKDIPRELLTAHLP